MCAAAAGTAIISHLSVKCGNIRKRIKIVFGEVGTPKSKDPVITLVKEDIF